MFELQMLIIFLGLIGTFMVFYFSPQVDSRTFLYQSSEMIEIEKRDKRKRILAKRGMILVTSSFFIQIGVLVYGKYF